MAKMMVGNFKMNLNQTEILDYIRLIQVNPYYKDAVYCPSSIYLPYFVQSNIPVGVQNIASFANGAYTGEIAAEQVKSMGASFVIVGHSERRILFHETDAEIYLKIKEALKSNLKVILCIGEKEEERKDREDILRKQLENCIQDLPLENIIIAYEPVWAIGTGHVMEVEEIKKVCLYIKDILGKSIPVLYGGSVNENNINILSTIKEIDGFLVGGASIHPEVFLKMIEVAVTM